MKTALLLICTLFTTIALSVVENPQSCVNCGMNRETYAFSRVLIVFDDTLKAGTCSIACAHKVAADNASKKITSLKVADFTSQKLIDAQTAIWVVGGKKPGVMSSTPVWAFSDKGGAKKFIAAFGGKLATFQDVWEGKIAGCLCGKCTCGKCTCGQDTAAACICGNKCTCGAKCTCGPKGSVSGLSSCRLPSASSGKGAQGTAKTPGEQDKCPVCGMFVAKYPGFLAQIQFKDGTNAFFDGPKDFFKYYGSLDTYNPGKKAADIGKVLVTDYYTQEAIDGLAAWYVIGSDINGPMGRELVPFATEAAAGEFKKDHNGSAVLRFKEVTPEMLKSLE
jgi:nitrous oxide reductase accessory protein NosL